MNCDCPKCRPRFPLFSVAQAFQPVFIRRGLQWLDSEPGPYLSIFTWAVLLTAAAWACYGY